MAETDLPTHVVSRRRDGRREVLLHRSVGVISAGRVEIRSARSVIVIPAFGLLLAALAGWLISEGGLPLWALVLLLLFCLVSVPASVMGVVSFVAGADVVADRAKGSVTMQQGYLGMGIGTKELVPFAKIDHLEVTIEGDQPDRWRGERDALRQFALVLVKASGKRLTLAQVPVAAGDQNDGMDRTLAVANAIAAVAGTEVRIPDGWELVEIDAGSGERLAPPPPPTRDATVPPRRRSRGRRR